MTPQSYYNQKVRKRSEKCFEGVSLGVVLQTHEDAETRGGTKANEVKERRFFCD